MSEKKAEEIINQENKTKFLKDVGNRIRLIRKEKNMSQEDLAVECNADTRKIGGTERGEFNFQLSSLLVLAKGLDTDCKLKKM